MDRKFPMLISQSFEHSQGTHEFFLEYCPAKGNFGADVFFHQLCAKRRIPFNDVMYKTLEQQKRMFDLPRYPAPENKYKFLATTKQDQPETRNIAVDFLDDGMKSYSSILSIRGHYNIYNKKKASYRMRVLEKNLPAVQTFAKELVTADDAILRQYGHFIGNFVECCTASLNNQPGPILE